MLKYFQGDYIKLNKKMERKKGLFDKKEDDDPFFAQHEYAEKMKSRIPGSWMVSLNPSYKGMIEIIQ